MTGTLHMLVYNSDIESHQEFQKWHNGGGIFHQSACIDSTVLIEVGAIVHSKAVLGANVCIGSGTVVGPAVTVGQSTNIGYLVNSYDIYSQLLMFDSSYNYECFLSEGLMLHSVTAL